MNKRYLNEWATHTLYWTIMIPRSDITRQGEYPIGVWS